MRIAVLVGVALILAQICLAAPNPPTAATTAFLGQYADRKGLVQERKLVSLYGMPLLVSAPRDPEDHAATDVFVAAYIANQANCDAMGVDGVTLEFVDKVTSPTNRFSVYKYGQRMLGLPVHGSVVNLVVYQVPTPLSTTDKISLINIRLTPNPEVALPQDTITSSEALATVEDVVQSESIYQGINAYSFPEKVIFERDDGTIYRAWRIRASAFTSAFLFFVDAAGGQIIGAIDQSVHADVSGTIFGRASADTAALHGLSPVELVAMPGVQVSVSGQASTFASATGSYGFTGLAAGTGVTLESRLIGEWVTVLDVPCVLNEDPECSAADIVDMIETGNVTPPATSANLIFNNEALPIGSYSPYITGQINTFLGVQSAHDWFKGLSAYNGVDQNVRALVNVVEYVDDSMQIPKCNARYILSSTPPTVVFFVDPSFSVCHSSAFGSNISHELAHAYLDQRLKNIEDAFHEGFADTFASLFSNNACHAEGWLFNDPGQFPCVRHMDGADPDLEGFKNCTGSACEVKLQDARCGPVPHCLGSAMAGAFWDLRTAIGDAATERIFADFFLITDGFLDQSVIISVLAADDDDGDLRTFREGGYADQIIAAFQGIHGWEDPFALQDIKVDWDGPDPELCPPFEGLDYFVTAQIFPPHVSLRTTEKCGDEILRWFIGRRDLQTGTPFSLGTVTADWDGPLHDADVWIGTEFDKPCRNVKEVIIPAQSANHWSSVRTDLSGSVDTIACDANTNGVGGRFSGLVAGSVGPTGGSGPTLSITAASIGEGANQSGILDARSLRLSSGEVAIPSGSTVRAESFTVAGLALQTPLGGTIEDKNELVNNISLSAGMVETGRIKINGDMRGPSPLSNLNALAVTGAMGGSVEVSGSLTGRIVINGDIPATGSIRINGDILPNTLSPPYAIEIIGNVAGSIFADWDADGVGTISGPVLMGDFSGDICDASDTMLLNHELPGNVFIGGSFTGRVCPPRTPLPITSLPHSATKSRMISINPRSTNNNLVALKVALTEMLRCSTTTGIACTTGSDCPSGETCQNHGDVGDSWWVGPPIDPTCQDAFGDPIDDADCAGSFMVSRVVDSPIFRVWNEPVVHVADCEIVPAATYAIQTTEDSSTFTPPTLISTTGKPSVEQFGDIVGAQGSGGWSPPDGIVNMNDVQAILLAISSPANAPDNTWADIAPGIGPNAKVNVTDVMFGVLAAQGVLYHNPFAYRFDPGDCPDESEPPPVMAGNPVTLALSGSDNFLDPEEWLYVDVFTGAADEIGAYEIALEVSGGTAGTLVLADIDVDTTRSDYVFGTATIIEGKSVNDGKVAVVRQDGGTEVVGTKYLATFVYQPASGASGVFQVALKDEGASLLNDGHGNLLPITLGAENVVGVGIDCWETWHCNDNNACTSDACVNEECVFTNVTQGSACNDGHYCTTTDTCNGSGLCTGTGNPCPPRTHWCNEFQDQCEEFMGGGEQ